MSNFEVIPAIDILDGKCVRLTRGDYSIKEVYSDSPADMAKTWEKKGAKRLHVVDLDGAKSGEPKNLETIKAIINNVKIPIQVGGGIRTVETVEALFKIGVDRVILGTAAVKNPNLIRSLCEKYGDKIIVGIDSKEGKAQVEGWHRETAVTDIDLAKEIIKIGVKRIIYTDISRDGTLAGPNIEGMKEFAKAVIVPVIASGGVSSKEDIEALRKLETYGVEGCIVGKALYEGKVKLEEVL